MPLIVFEGIDGSGKGTQIEKTAKFLASHSEPCCLIKTKEPGGTALGEDIRNVIFGRTPTQDMAPGVVDLLFLASHVQNVKTVVGPALAQNKIVLCDRWWYSQEAYGSFREIPNCVRAAYDHLKGPRADLVLFFKGDPEVLLNRARSRTTETHQEKKNWNNNDLISKIQSKYLELFKNFPEMRIVDVRSRDEENVWKEVREIVNIFLEANKSHATSKVKILASLSESYRKVCDILDYVRENSNADETSMDKILSEMRKLIKIAEEN